MALQCSVGADEAAAAAAAVPVGALRNQLGVTGTRAAQRGLRGTEPRPSSSGVSQQLLGTPPALAEQTRETTVHPQSPGGVPLFKFCAAAFALK